MENDSKNSPQFYQEEDYNFPYHHLPQLNNGFWSFGISWFHSLDYLTILEFILIKIKQKNAKKILDFGCGDGRLVKELINEDKNDFEIQNSSILNILVKRYKELEK